MYQTSLIACARWEVEHIEEWIKYHLFIGFDHIYLYCNDDDPTQLYEKVAVYCKSTNPQVTFLHYPFQGQQWKMYYHYLDNHKGESQYISFLDIDEFITLKQHKNIQEFIHQFDKSEWDSIIFNSLLYGNNFYETRPAGNVLENYTRRSKTLEAFHLTKALIKTKSINNAFIRHNRMPFWHGKGSDRQVFDINSTDINVLGEDYWQYVSRYMNLNLENPQDIALSREKMQNAIIDQAYIAHFKIKSREDAKRRIERGFKGDFSGQREWEDKLNSQEQFDQFLVDSNEYEDFYLRDLWRSFFKICKQDLLFPLPPGPNLAKGCFCDQSSISPWSGDGSSTSADAKRVVDIDDYVSHKHHTSYEEDPWWYVQFPKVTEIKEVRLFQRQEIILPLNNISMDISDTGNYWTEIAKLDEGSGFNICEYGQPLIVKLPKVSCNYFRIRLRGHGALQFTKIEIY